MAYINTFYQAARLEHTRLFDVDSGTVAFVHPLPARNRILVGILDPVGTLANSGSKKKETRVGSMSVLSLYVIMSHTAKGILLISLQP